MARALWLSAILLGLFHPRLARAGEPASVHPEAPRHVRQTVQRAIGYLQTESSTWLKQGRCASCHHVSMPLWALSEAGRQGFTIDKKFLADTTEATLGSQQKMIASQVVSNPKAPPDPRPMGRGVNIGAVFLAAAAWSMPSLQEGQRQSLRLILDDVVKKQREDGSWEFFLSRPPINECQATDAAWIVMALQGETGPEVAESHRASLKKAMAWLARAESSKPQVKVLKLLVAIRAGEHRGKFQPALDELLASQQPDGGWSQLDGAPSDAFATGEALYVLALAGYTVERPGINRAVEFLVATQKADGSWPMASRATPDGKPGAAKLLTPITCGASAWATLGLARLAPQTP